MAQPARPRPRVPRFLKRGITLLILIFVIIYLVVPTFAAAGKNLKVLTHVNWWLLIIAIGLEAAAQFSYAELTRTLLPRGALPMSKIFRINLSALAVSHILPGGTAGGTPVGYRLMTQNGVRGADVGVAAATQGIGSAVVLNAMLWLALLVSIPFKGFSATYVGVAVFGALAMALFAALILGFTKGEDRASRVFRGIARRIPWITEEQVEGVIRRIGQRLRALGQDRQLLVQALSYALLNWGLDAAALWACVAAFGWLTNPVYLLVAYGVGNVLAAIPITPGGLGLVEASVPFLLAGFGVNGSKALLGVLAWRLVNFWLPIPVGAGAYVSLRVGHAASLHDHRAALGGMTAQPPGGRITTPRLALEEETLQLEVTREKEPPATPTADRAPAESPGNGPPAREGPAHKDSGNPGFEEHGRPTPAHPCP